MQGNADAMAVVGGEAAEAGRSAAPRAPYYDRELACWVVSRYADVLTALREPSLLAGKHKDGRGAAPEAERARLAMRAETLEALGPAQLDAWRERLAAQAELRAERLPAEQPVDVIASYARPLGRALAEWVTNISAETAAELSERARVVSAAAADPENAAGKAAAERAEAEMAAHFVSGPAALRDSTFVALAETVPCILANAWLALMEQPEQWRRLHAEPALLDQGIEELLRYAGLVRRLFRTASEDRMLGGAPIHRGDVLMLKITLANHDPERFACPHLLDLARRDGGHLALGAGLHACVGASLIRMAVQIITQPLLRRFEAARLARPVEWQGGATFASPRELWAELREGISFSVREG